MARRQPDTVNVPGLTVLFDFRSAPCYLALAPTLALVDELAGRGADGRVRFEVLLVAPPARPVEPAEPSDRGGWHRWHRARYREHDLIRYARALGLPARHFEDGGIYRNPEGQVAAMGHQFLGDDSRPYLEAVFAGYWDGDLDLDSPDAIGALTGDPEGFAAYCGGEGPARLESAQAALREAGRFDVPGYLVGGQIFYGRQHLPWVRGLCLEEAM